VTKGLLWKLHPAMVDQQTVPSFPCRSRTVTHNDMKSSCATGCDVGERYGGQPAEDDMHTSKQQNTIYSSLIQHHSSMYL
jgi:hypothetical protein